MANYVAQIVDAIETQIATTLGASYSKLKYVYDIEKNSFKGNANKYGVRPLEASSVSGVVRASTLDQVFEVTLVDEYRNEVNSDTALQEAVENLYSKMNDLEKQFYKSKIGLPSIVLLVTLDSILESEVIESNKIVALRGNFTVKYRTLID